VVKADKLDDKTLIHNYGHGGAGMSLSWGTGYLAAELALEQESRRAAVIGSGVVGLTTGRQLQERGFDVTIYAMAVPPNTTSNMSWASFTPGSGLVEIGGRTPEWDAQFRSAVGIAYKRLQLLVGPKYGVSWMNSYSMMNEMPAAGTQQGTGRLLPPEFRTGRVILGPGEHPLPSRYASSRPALRFEPSIYLDALMKDFVLFGGEIVIRKFDAPQDMAALTEPVVVNCTGLGSKALFDDQELIPVKGQLTVMVPQSEVDYSTLGGLPGAGGGNLHMLSRGDGIILGGTNERGEWSLAPNEEERRRVVEGHIELFEAMRSSALGRWSPTTRSAFTPSETPSVESFFGLES
jgi:glycine/D-amino acid oxidase-like deaminating enzyme